MGVGSGPVPLHAEMTSGSSGTIRSVATDTTEAMAKVRESIELIRYAQDRPAWDSDMARQSYNMRAWATRASSEICFNRLNRVTLALEVAADGYDHMEKQADETLAWYRREKPKVVDALGMFVLMFTATNNLLAVRGYYSDDLATALERRGQGDAPRHGLSERTRHRQIARHAGGRIARALPFEILDLAQ